VVLLVRCVRSRCGYTGSCSLIDLVNWLLDGNAQDQVLEMTLQAENDEDLYSWVKAIAHLQIRNCDPVQSLVGIRAAQAETVRFSYPVLLIYMAPC